MADGSVGSGKKGRKEAAARWFGILGLVAAAVVVVLVPAVLDLDAVIRLPEEAYGPPKLAVLMVAAAPLLVAVAGVLAFGGRPRVVPVLVPALTFLGVSGLSALLSGDFRHTLFGDRDEGLIALAGLVLLFYALARSLTSWARVRLFLAAGVTAAALVSVFGLSQNFGVDTISGWNNVPFTDLGRPLSSVGNALTLAAYLTPMMGAAAALYLGAGSGPGRAGWLLALALIGACWILTESRGAYLGAAVALPVVLLVARHKLGTARPLLVPLAVLAAAMAAAIAASAALGFSALPLTVSAALAAYLVLVGALAWITRRGTARSFLAALAVVAVLGAAAVVAAASTGSLSSLDAATGREEGNQMSTEIRLLIWRDTARMILDRPLLGYGPDNYEGPFEPYISDGLAAAIRGPDGEAGRVDRAHNDFLHTAATTGLLGLAAYLWVLVSYFRNAYASGGWTLTALAGGVFAYVVQLQTAFPSLPSSVAFWGILGASVAVMRLRALEERPTEGQEETGGATPRPEATPAGSSARGARELLVVVAVVALLAAIAVPAFFEQREKAVKLERQKLGANVTKFVTMYEFAGKTGNPYPKAGTYTYKDPLRLGAGATKLRPSKSVEITTTTPPDGGFSVRGESTVQAGTFRYNYDSATGE